jgi:uncharacterized protein YdhG (YjbR/CyaY superfamily)
MRRAKDVDEYIAHAPATQRSKLKELRVAIKSAAPNAVERISYGMPHYAYKGRLAYFGLAKSHIGFYIMTPIIREHERELKAYKTTSATIRFPLSKKLPVALIKKLVRARAKRNEERETERR